MRLRTINLYVPPKIIEEFKKQAKRSFPKESFAYLLGRDAGTQVEIEELHTPHGVEQHCTEGSVSIGENWLSEARKEARTSGLTVVGDIHSHPFLCPKSYSPGCAPSEGDLDDGMTQIHGICQVWKTKSDKLQAKVRFWGPIVPVKVNII